MNDLNLLTRDREAVWHPFTPLLYAPNNIVIERGEGASFIASDGTRYLDGIASWWVNLHGHCQPQIVEAVANQAARLEHAIFAGFTHQPGIALAEGLLRHLPGFSKVFFSDNGSTAVEVALKMAVQYWWNKGEPRRKIIAFREAYHGDTFGGMSVAARNAFNRPFEGLLFDVVHLELPTADNIEDVAKELEIHLQTGDACCFIFEPLVLGAGGMLMYEAAHLSRLINLCRLHGCLTIADEVMTGFGRTGTFFAIDQLSSQPDIICLSKGLTGGFFPLGATVCTEAIYNAYLVNDKTKTFFHGHSYTGNPITCAAALASLQLMEQESTWQHINRIHQAHIGCAAALQSAPGVEQVRVTGTILAMNVKTSEATGYLNSKADDLAAFFIQRNIILRPLGNVLYVLPPYCISQEELQSIYNAIIELLLP